MHKFGKLVRMVIRAFTEADYTEVGRIALQVHPETQLTAARLREGDRTRARHLETGGFLAEIAVEL